MSAYSEYPTPNCGGPNKVIYELVRSLDHTKWNVGYMSKHLYIKSLHEIYLQSFKTTQLSFMKRIGIEFQKSNLYRRTTTNPFYLSIFFRRANRILEKYSSFRDSFDIIHSHDVRAMYFLKGKKSGKKILTIHSKGPIEEDISQFTNNSNSLKKYYNTFSAMERESIMAADVITFPSFEAKRLFLNKVNYSISENKIEVVYNGIDINRIKNIDINEHQIENFGVITHYDLLILNVAAHIPVKNIEILIKTVYLLKQSGINAILINVGHGPLTKSYNELIQKLNIQKNIKLISNLPNDEVIRLMKVSDFFAMAADNVVFDYVILEALACGCVVVANNSGGNKEVIKDGVNGYLINENTPESFRDKILNHEIEIKEKAIRTAENYDISYIVKHYEELYN